MSEEHEIDCAKQSHSLHHEGNWQNKNLKSQDHHVNYIMNNINKKIEADDRIYSVTPQLTKGNKELIFSAAAYEEFKYITII